MFGFLPVRHRASFVLSRRMAAFLAVAAGSLGSTALAVPSFSVLYNFYGLDGANPNGKVLVDASGNIYGTTFNGGVNGLGSVFKLTPSNGAFTEEVLYSFAGASDGANPAAGLVMGAKGALYGAASMSNGTTNGTIFELTPPVGGVGSWKFNVIHLFGIGSDGAFPNSDLLMGSKGALYGTTVLGGASGQGCAFVLVPPGAGGGRWTETVLYSFKGTSDGANPYSAVTFDQNGNLYGTASAGGTGSSGTVFKLSPPVGAATGWSETTLYAFKGGNDGNGPLAGVLVGAKGSIFGTTFLGGPTNNGTVFQLTPGAGGAGYTETLLYSFKGTDGANPSDALLQDQSGNFYGTTGGAVAGTGGTVFKLVHSKAGTYSLDTLYSFTDVTSGQNPLASVVKDANGNLLGTTFYGGGGSGNVFEISN